MGRWKTTIRELSAEIRLHRYARALARRNDTAIHPAALYGAFAAIGAMVLGALSIHPF